METTTLRVRVPISSPICAKIPTYDADTPSLKEAGGIVIRSYLQGHALRFSSNLTAVAAYHPHVNAQNYSHFFLTPTSHDFFWAKNAPEGLFYEMIDAGLVWLKNQQPNEKRVIILNETAPERVKTPQGGLRSQPWEHIHCISFSEIEKDQEVEEVEVECAETEVENDASTVVRTLREMPYDNFSAAFSKADEDHVRLHLVTGASDPWILFGVKPARIFSEDLEGPCPKYVGRSLKAARDLAIRQRMSQQ